MINYDATCLPSHLVRTLQVLRPSVHLVCGVRSQRFSTQISHRRCRTEALPPASPCQTADNLSRSASSPAGALYWTDYQSFLGLIDVDVRKPPTWLNCAPPHGSGHKLCFLRCPPAEKHQQVHLDVFYFQRRLLNRVLNLLGLTFLSKSADRVEAAAPAPIVTPSSGALYRPRPESSCHSPGPDASALVRATDRTMGSSRRKWSMVLLCSWSLSFPFSNCKGT